MDLFIPGSHGSTFGGNDIACAIALKALELLNDDALLADVRGLGDYLGRRLREMEGMPFAQVRQVGLWVGIDLHQGWGTAKKACEMLVRAGLLCKYAHGQTLRISPPLVITRELIDEALGIIQATLGEQ